MRPMLRSSFCESSYRRGVNDSLQVNRTAASRFRWRAWEGHIHDEWRLTFQKGSIGARQHSLSPVPPATHRARGGFVWSSGPEQPLVDYLAETNEQQSTRIERRLHIFKNKDM